MWVLVRFVRFGFGSIPISALVPSCALGQPVRQASALAHEGSVCCRTRERRIRRKERKSDRGQRSINAIYIQSVDFHFDFITSITSINFSHALFSVVWFIIVYAFILTGGGGNFLGNISVGRGQLSQRTYKHHRPKRNLVDSRQDK